MDSEAYWKKRAEEREQYWHKKSQQTIETELAKQYQEALGHIQTDIAALYGRYARDNKLSVADARKIIQGSEYKQWRMSLEEYVAKIKDTGDKGLQRELDTLAMRSRISRLDKLYSETLQELDGLGRNVSKSMKSFLSDAYKDNYYHGLYDISKTGNMMSTVSKVDSKSLEDVLRNSWSGKNYSQRIWKNQRALASTIKSEITNAVHRGESVAKISKRVAKRMDVGTNQATRLVRTELNYIQNQSALDSIDDAGMKYYKFIATLDRRTSTVCRYHDRHTYAVKDAQSGTNMPPMHPNCRSTISGSLRGPDDKKTTGTRIARGDNGKTYQIPDNMDYDNWKSVYIDKTKTMSAWESEHATASDNKIMLSDTQYPQQFQAKAEKKRTSAVCDYVNAVKDRDMDVVDVYSRMGAVENATLNGSIPWKVAHSTSKGMPSSYVVTWSKGRTGELSRIEISIPKMEGDVISGQATSALHEEMHFMDLMLGDYEKCGDYFSVMQDDLKKAVEKYTVSSDKMHDDLLGAKSKKLFTEYRKKCNESFEHTWSEMEKKEKSLYNDFNSDTISFKEYQKEHNKLRREYSKKNDYEARNLLGGGVDTLEDIYDALSHGNALDTSMLLGGHGRKYYFSQGACVREIVANYGALSVTRPDLIAILKEEKPELVEALEAVIKKMKERASWLVKNKK